jgi:MYXO-CTERM domain-containing protein
MKHLITPILALGAVGALHAQTYSINFNDITDPAVVPGWSKDGGFGANLLDGVGAANTASGTPSLYADAYSEPSTYTAATALVGNTGLAYTVGGTYQLSFDLFKSATGNAYTGDVTYSLYALSAAPAALTTGGDVGGFDFSGGTLLASAVAGGTTEGSITLTSLANAGGAGTVWVAFSVAIPQISGFTYTQVEYDNISVSVIPEPSAFAALAGLGALALVATRRRRA